METDVLIVGAGPTGLMAANQLMRHGIDFILVDSKAGPTIESRAILVTSRSLEIYQQMNLDSFATTHGVAIKSFNLFSGGKRKAEVRLGDLGKGLSEFSYMLAFEQSRNEELMASNLAKQGKSILWNHEFIALDEHKECIRARVKENDEVKNIRAKYLIACDGAKSLIRHQLNFSFKGGTYEHKFFVVDTTVDWNQEYNKLILAPGRNSFCAFLPLYGDKTYRVLGTLPKEFANRENITFEEIESVVHETFAVPIKFGKVNWFSTYKLHHRAVEQFRSERVFLAGDSAHIHSPAGGQGMNTGLQDAYNLCWKLAFVLKKYSTENLLDTYNEERLPFAKFLLRFTDRGFNMMTNTNWFIRIFRRYIVMNLANTILSFQFVRRMVFKTISQTGYSYKKSSLAKTYSKQRLKFQAGDRLPYLENNSVSAKLYESFTKPSFHILSIGADSINEEARQKLDKLFPFPVQYVENQLSEAWKKLGVTKPIYILVRPDNYIGFISDSLDEPLVQDYLKEYFQKTEN